MERCTRPWGWYETLTEGEGYLVKRLWLEPGQRLSLQRHQHRLEHWYVAAGEGVVNLDGTQHKAQAGSSFDVPCSCVHRATAGDQGLLIVEVQRGSILREDDIERFADDYGRVAAPVG
ncbi:mannose-6-phosphate isomerase [Synechococcus sp. Minos11]|uniref:phosphomannose isomerase type II C-terminal cupin domain n=1 Tax=Synechococcus sp. Minos11 TaxID=221341 RepID=UPI001648EBE5|nr:phosphomannose isomerase type II C-terminal cupin domain [Synechococcus sp. Minos11]QNJ09147.1 mannose-6-phosphate isomerase [Synechococcus sp. Minos11]|tara:strand:+ start:118 stop:471 length:354 start_codon:yes stop_codon:yes gene_type:complete